MAPPQWAYQVENFVNEPDEELVCSICRAVFCDPVMCPCDHVFCRACITKWIQSSRNCPICRKRVSYSSVKQTVPIVRNIIMKLMLNCHNKTLGCTAKFSVESSEAHVKECEYELVQCKNKPCKDRLFRKDIAEHETSDCPHRYIKCKTCGLKMPTSAVPEKHDCVRALQLRLRRKNNMIRKKNGRIKELRNEIKSLKSATQGSEQSSTSRGFAHLASSLSPEEIMINIAEFDSTSSSLTSDSEESSEDDIIIFANSSLSQSENTESDSFLTFMDNNDSIEYSRNESPIQRDFSEYRNAESQTTDDMVVEQTGDDNTFFETGNSSGSPVLFLPCDNNCPPSRPGKRRPTTQKPAKRRFPLSASSDFVESTLNSSPETFTETDRRTVGSSHRSSVEAGPSSEAGPSIDPRGNLSNSDWNCCPTLSKQKSINHANTVSKRDEVMNTVAPSRNAMFERTLSLLEQYNLESDPEWLPEYASHRGDTSSDTDASYVAEFINGSSSSELSECDSNNEDNSNLNQGDISDLVNCSFDTTSDEDDPDWNPLNCLGNRYA